MNYFTDSVGMLLMYCRACCSIPIPSLKAASRRAGRVLLGMVGDLRYPDEYLPRRISRGRTVRELCFGMVLGLTRQPGSCGLYSVVTLCC